MASTTALFTGLSGLSANARRLDVIGNNIANVNTTAFKANRMMFAPTFSRTFSMGTAPAETTGGANPGQVGLGASIAGTQRNFNNGAISATGVASDVAIEGDGFFIVRNGTERFYTRAGAFQRNAANDLVTVNGSNVMGYGVDDQFRVVTSDLVNLNIPIGTLTVAEPTRNVVFNGNLNASGATATTGSIHTTRAFYTDAGLTTLLNTANFDLTVPGNDLYIDDGAGGSFLALEGGAGTVITVRGVEKGGKDLGTRSFAFSATAVSGVDDYGATLQDFMDFLDGVFGLNSTGVNGQDLGGSISFSNGQIVVTGNEGTAQDLNIETADLVATNAGNGISQPFVMSRTGSADGESVRTSFVVYDSLGTPLTVDLTLVLQQSTPGEGTTWMFLAESTDNNAIDRVLGIGLVTFDASGRLVSTSNDAFSLIRTNGAVSPLTVTMQFDDGANAISALTDQSSQLAAVFQDGSPIGTLSNFSIGENGVISGAFTNGLVRTLGQIALAKFTNPEGLVDVGNSLFAIGPNSGSPIVATPQQFGTGRLVSGALELSNVDLSLEFINMILTSTGYSAASRVITTTDELMQQLLRLGA
ncbi:MAG: flagellar hook-basal body complex protein [Phycisphaeraceae bacterium]|nr:MAG: flagellar hook-basal body complex protein [Phycisphaeraceae bacterium]